MPTGVCADVQPRLPGQIEDDADLAREYMPVLAFSDGQRWAPEPVSGYFAAASIGKTVPLSAQTPRKASAVKADVTRAQPTRGALPTTCPPGAPRPCWHLHCDSAAEAGARTHDDLSGPAWRPRASRQRTESDASQAMSTSLDPHPVGPGSSCERR